MKPTHCLFVAASFVVSPSTLHAAIYNWASATAGGDYSLTTNWSPAAPAGGPGSVDTAVLTDVTSGTRVVAYDNAAAATIQQLDFNQTTAGAINQFNILKTGTITNAVTLAATAGTEEIRFSSASAFTFTLGNALTVNTGGLLNFHSATGLDGRFQVNGNFTVAGGEVKNTSGFSTTLVLQGGTNSISPTGAFGSNIAISMAGGNQTLASTVALNNILLRGSGALVKTISGTSVGRIAFINAANNGSTTLKLGSNLTSSSLPFAENFSQGATVNFGIDTGAGFTLDLTGNAARSD